MTTYLGKQLCVLYRVYQGLGLNDRVSPHGNTPIRQACRGAWGLSQLGGTPGACFFVWSCCRSSIKRVWGWVSMLQAIVIKYELYRLVIWGRASWGFMHLRGPIRSVQDDTLCTTKQKTTHLALDRANGIVKHSSPRDSCCSCLFHMIRCISWMWVCKIKTTCCYN